MVVFTPLPTFPVTPGSTDSAIVSLQNEMHDMNQQMVQFMEQFHNQAATPSAPVPSPGTYVATGDVPVVTPSTPTSSVASVSTTPSHLEPTPDGQGLPPAIASSTSKLIGDTLEPLRLLYTPRSSASHRRQIPPRPIERTDFSTTEDTRHLHAWIKT
jgi:hypothetical protein